MKKPKYDCSTWDDEQVSKVLEQLDIIFEKYAGSRRRLRLKTLYERVFSFQGFGLIRGNLSEHDLNNLRQKFIEQFIKKLSTMETWPGYEGLEDFMGTKLKSILDEYDPSKRLSNQYHRARCKQKYGSDLVDRTDKELWVLTRRVTPCSSGRVRSHEYLGMKDFGSFHDAEKLVEEHR